MVENIKLDNIKYPCTLCGCCCKRVDKTVAQFNLLGFDIAFDFKWDKTGRCENLTIDNKCSIYETRPLICNIDKLFHFVNIPKAQFYAMNIASCNLMMDEDGMNDSYKIK